MIPPREAMRRVAHRGDGGDDRPRGDLAQRDRVEELGVGHPVVDVDGVALHQRDDHEAAAEGQRPDLQRGPGQGAEPPRRPLAASAAAARRGQSAAAPRRITSSAPQASRTSTSYGPTAPRHARPRSVGRPAAQVAALAAARSRLGPGAPARRGPPPPRPPPRRRPPAPRTQSAARGEEEHREGEDHDDGGDMKPRPPMIAPPAPPPGRRSRSPVGSRPGRATDSRQRWRPRIRGRPSTLAVDDQLAQQRDVSGRSTEAGEPNASTPGQPPRATPGGPG